MSDLRIRAFGPTELKAGGRLVPLTPTTRRLLIRLIAADRQPVPVSELHHDIWGRWGPSQGRARLTRGERTEVQKRVLELRRALDTARPGLGSEVLVTDQLMSGSYPESAYRLKLRPDELDCAEFAHLIGQAQTDSPAIAVEKLARALELWRGAPLADAAGDEFAAPMIDRLTRLRDTARTEAVRLHTLLGRPERALSIAEQLAAAHPGDDTVHQTLESVRAQIRASRLDELLTFELPQLNTRISIARGELRSQGDANLAIGVSDTASIQTEAELVGTGPGGQLIERIADQTRRRTLTAPGLATSAASGTAAGPRDSARRYPPGTVVPLVEDGTRIYATVIATLNESLIVQMSEHDLREGLSGLWAAAARDGMYRPLAVPVFGNHTASWLTREQTIMVIIDSFQHYAADNIAPTPELRIVVRPDDLARTDLADIARQTRPSPGHTDEPGYDGRKTTAAERHSGPAR